MNTNLSLEIWFIEALLAKVASGNNHDVLFLTFQTLCDLAAGGFFSYVDSGNPCDFFGSILGRLGACRARDGVVLGSVLLRELEAETACRSDYQNRRHLDKR